MDSLIPKQNANTFGSTSPLTKQQYGTCKQCGKQFEIRAPKMTSSTELSKEAVVPDSEGSTKFSKMKTMFRSK